MEDLGIRRDRAPKAVPSGAQLEVDVLEIERICFVQKSDLVEHLSTDQDECALDGIDVLADDEHMLRQAAAAPTNAGRPNPVGVRPSLNRADETDRRVGLG